MNKTLGAYILCAFCALLFVCCAGEERHKEKTSVEPEQNSGTIKVQGTELSYVIEGSGLPCIVTGYATFVKPTFSQELRKHIKFVFADFRHANVSGDTINYSEITLDTLVEDIEQIRLHLGYKKIAVLGHSANGWIALEYAKKYPQHTSHVIMIGAPLYYWSEEYMKKAEEIWASEASTERKEVLKNNWEKLTDEVLDGVSPGKAFILRYIANGPRYWYDSSYDAAWLWEGQELDMGMYNQVYGVILKDYDVLGSANKISSPVFSAVGRYDLWLYHPWAENQDKIGTIALEIFDRSAHFPELEEQALFDQMLIEWLENN